MLRFDKSMGLFANAVYAYNSDEDEKRTGPVGVQIIIIRAFGKIYWSQAENVSIEKEAGVTYKGSFGGPRGSTVHALGRFNVKCKVAPRPLLGHYEADRRSRQMGLWL